MLRLEEGPVRRAGGGPCLPADLGAGEGDAAAGAARLAVVGARDGAEALGDEGAVDGAVLGAELVGDQAAAGDAAAALGQEIDEARDEGRGGADRDEATAAIIGPDVRAAFMTLAPLEPQLFIRRGIAELQWKSLGGTDPASMLPDAAFAVLLGIRAAIERA